MHELRYWYIVGSRRQAQIGNPPTNMIHTFRYTSRPQHTFPTLESSDVKNGSSAFDGFEFTTSR